MLPFEFTVDGPPLSHQTKNRTKLRVWRDAVRNAALRYWPLEQSPVIINLRIVVVYYHDEVAIRMDNDNMIKPIQDALNGLIYVDDRQITDIVVRKTNLNSDFRIRNLSPVLAESLSRGSEFLYIRVEEAPDHRELL